MKVERIIRNKKLYAIIIYDKYNNSGVEFFTPDDFSQQLAFISHKTGKIIEPHIHTPYSRNITYTQEVLFIKKGELKVYFYDTRRKYFANRNLKKGDVILLATGGHGFKVIKDVKMLEVKQGPYSGEKDKIRFKSTVIKG